MTKIYIGIDNGVTGSIGIINECLNTVFFIKTPVKKEQSYTKAKQNITRINGHLLKQILQEHIENNTCFCLIERPMVNPSRWKASVSAIRALEATLTIIEDLKIPYQYIDSKEWQKALLPNGSAKEELKKDSLNIGKRLFPNVESIHDDMDGLLIAEYAKRKNF